MIQILELFGGIGAPRCALRNMGVPTKAIDYVEIDEKAVRSYNAMFADALINKPQTIVGWNLKPDVLIHGSPCQDFSIAGYQKGANEGSETRSSLMWETLRIIAQMGEWKPKIVIWENVKNVLSRYMKKNFDNYIIRMEQLGYINNYKVLNAIDYGLPQNRERVFVVSVLDGMFNFELMEKKKPPHIKEYLQNDFLDRYIITQPSMLKKIGNHNGKAFAGRLTPITDHCKTITTKQLRCPNSGIIPIGNNKYRLLTELECWRLQGYSDDDYYNASQVNGTTALYAQAGNSIPVTIFESMFRSMIEQGLIMC